MNHIVQKFQHFYVPSQCMSLDEGMIPAKNRLAIKQYIRMKPVKQGIKSFLLCESDTGCHKQLQPQQSYWVLTVQLPLPLSVLLVNPTQLSNIQPTNFLALPNSAQNLMS